MIYELNVDTPFLHPTPTETIANYQLEVLPILDWKPLVQIVPAEDILPLWPALTFLEPLEQSSILLLMTCSCYF